MYLKRLEISGFKSFANRTKLSFAPGITAVVGPNGSGKSNVTDSIRWVLGEQSAKSLRGAKMEDVIFAGSSSRKPVGYCEVSITFDNTDRKLFLDYADVTVTRRVYRSGESEYLLNRQNCRLKDIHELFMDTGIGKEAYSMIGQGRIDEILSAKSEGRRAIFEEAAGIVKYKARKKEAEKKLEDTAENLARVHDLIYELDTQITPLAEQAEQAKLWKETKSELTQHEIALYVHKIQALHTNWEATTQQVATMKEEQLALQTTMHQKEAAFEQLKGELHAQEQVWEQVQQKLLQASEELEKAEGKQSVAQERITQLSNQQASLRKRIQQAAQEQQQIEADQRQTKAQEQEKQQTFQTLTESLSSEQAVNQLPEYTASPLTELQTQLTKLDHRRIQLQEQAGYLRERIAQLTDEQQQVQRTKTQLSQTDSQAQREVTQLSNEIAELEVGQQQLTAQQAELTGQATQLRKHYEQLTDQLRNQERVVARMRSQIEVLQDLQASRGGYFRGVKTLLSAKDKGNHTLQGMHGAVAELISVPDQYETAIEMALGNAMQHLIVDNQQTAKAGIAFLKQHKLGRATFLPMNVIRPRQIAQHELAKCEQLDTWFELASSLVQTQPVYQPILDYLLGLVLVTTSIDDANVLSKTLQQRYRIITLAGDVVHPGGLMSGGSRKQSQTNLLGRNTQLERLTAEFETEQNMLIKLQEELAQIRQQQAQQQEKSAQLASEQAVQNETLLQHRQQLTERKIQLSNEQTQRKQVLDKEKQLTDQLQQLQAQLTHLEETSQQQTEQQATLISQIEQAEQEQQTRQAQKAASDQTMTNLQIQLAKLEQEQVYLEQTQQRLGQSAKQLAAQSTEMEQELAQVVASLETTQSHYDQLDDTVIAAKQHKRQVQTQLLTHKEQRERNEQIKASAEQDIHRMQKQVKQLSNQLHEQEVRINRLDVELNHLLQTLSEEYELSFERAQADYPLQGESEQVEKFVRAGKRKLAALGEVNLGAIDEYTRLKKRYDFLKQQETDLLQAKQTLYEMIGQIEQEMSQQFLEAYELIRAEFRLVFAQMFGGGEADLHLSMPDKLLESGIDIVAQPPGKRPQYLSLLSGGERALTAIALLFAVLKIKPVPFCVLDEVDAALDEVNLTRFTRYMQKFANQTQFIIITHRKQTMVGADVLYGITMAESGVSKLVSVQLEEWEKQQQQVAATRE